MNSRHFLRIFFTSFIVFDIVHSAVCESDDSWVSTEPGKSSVYPPVDPPKAGDDGVPLVGKYLADTYSVSYKSGDDFNIDLQIPGPKCRFGLDIKESAWNKFWVPFLLGLKPALIRQWFNGDWDTGGTDIATKAAILLTKSWATNARDGYKEAVPDSSVFSAATAKQSYVDELADFYYDEKVEEAREERSWLILNEQKKRAQRAAAHRSIYANDLLYDYYENVGVETRREQSATDQLQREREEVRDKRNKIMAQKNARAMRSSLRRNHKKPYNY